MGADGIGSGGLLGLQLWCLSLIQLAILLPKSRQRGSKLNFGKRNVEKQRLLIGWKRASRRNQNVISDCIYESQLKVSLREYQPNNSAHPFTIQRRCYRTRLGPRYVVYRTHTILAKEVASTPLRSQKYENRRCRANPTPPVTGGSAKIAAGIHNQICQG
jgi:hypothetical protein